MNLSVSVFSSVSVLAVLSVGCAHTGAGGPTPPVITAAAVAAPAPTPAPAPKEPAAAASDDADGDGESEQSSARSTPDKATEARKGEGEAKAGEAKSGGPMSFEELTAALGDDHRKLSLDVDHPDAPAAKPISASGYKAVGAAHQAAEASISHAGDVKVSGGLSAVAVGNTVRGSAARLRACYEHGLANNPRLAGQVIVRFSVDAKGAPSDVDTESDAMPGDVLGCVRGAFSAMTFTPPSAPPGKVVYPVDFNP